MRWTDALLVGGLIALFGVMHFARSIDIGLNHDEHQFIVPGALLARHGLIPFRDYPIFHLPNLTFVYALLDRLSSFVVLTNRTFSVLCATATMAIVAGVAACNGSRWSRIFPALLLLMVFCDPLFAFSSGKTWNHDLGSFFVVASVLCVAGNYSRQSLLLALLGGIFVGLATGTRLTFAPVAVPICFAPLFFVSRSATRWRLVVVTAAGVALAMLPSIWLYTLSPDKFWFDNFQFPRLRLLDANDTRAHKTIALWRKFRFFGKYIIRASWPIFAAYLLVGIRPAIQWWRDRSPELFPNALLASVLPFVLLGCFTPSRYQSQHFYAFIPLLALGVAYAARRDVGATRSSIYRVALVLLAGLSASLDIYSTEKGGYAWMGELRRPERWFPIRAHDLGAEIRKQVSHGKVLTLAPTLPIEAGLDVYPEFANGPFAWRLAHLLGDRQRAHFQIVAPADLESFLAKDPPAAVLTGFEKDDIEEPIRAYAERHGYRRVNLGKERLLWLK
jgi:hypothetical protein